MCCFTVISKSVKIFVRRHLRGLCGAGRFNFENSWMFDIAYFAILDLDLGSIEGSQRDNK